MGSSVIWASSGHTGVRTYRSLIISGHRRYTDCSETWALGQGWWAFGLCDPLSLILPVRGLDVCGLTLLIVVNIICEMRAAFLICLPLRGHRQPTHLPKDVRECRGRAGQL